MLPRIPILLVVVVLMLFACSDRLIQERNAETGLSSWKKAADGFSIELVQIVPDYVRAVYASRGFPATVVDRVSSYCVMGTIVRNTTDVPVAYRVTDWRYITPDRRAHPIRTKSQWVDEWRKLGVTFGWSILPDTQTFQPGDWGQGFLTIELPPGAEFSLSYSWTVDGKTRTARMEGLRCAPQHVETP